VTTDSDRHTHIDDATSDGPVAGAAGKLAGVAVALFALLWLLGLFLVKIVAASRLGHDEATIDTDLARDGFGAAGLPASWGRADRWLRRCIPTC